MMETAIAQASPFAASPRGEIFGARFDALTLRETLERIEGIIRNREPVQHVVINVAKVVMMQDDAALREAVNGCGLINVDGQGIVWAGRLLGMRIPERVAGIDLFLALIALAERKGYRPYLLGATREVLKAVEEELARRHPALRIAGSRDGYFRPEDEDRVAAGIRASGADMLFVAISSPKKELFLNRHLAGLGVPFAMGVGGSFDVVAGRVKRAPVWMQRAGMEWLHRLMSEPGRLWRRYLVTNARFAAMVFNAWITRGRDGQ